MPFKYSSILFAAIVVYAVFGEPPSLQMQIGIVIFIAAGFVIISRKAQLGIEGVKTHVMKYLIDPARPSIDKEDALDGVDKDLVGTV